MKHAVKQVHFVVNQGKPTKRGLGMRRSRR